LTPAARVPAKTARGDRYVAWLRAINVGGRVVKMDRLRSVFESLGLSNVETFIASGNVIFEARATTARELERRIEAGLAKALGYPVDVFLRSTREVAEIAAHVPFADREHEAGASMYVSFFRDQPPPDAKRKVIALRNDLDDFDVHRREVFWLRRNAKARAGEPWPALEKILAGPATMRNITTIRRIAARYCAD
jgi:uncharacterized protein (DUF1697 family)